MPWPVEDPPPSLRVDVYDGVSQPPADLSDVELYVVPYSAPDALDLLERMPALAAVQVLTAGYDHVLGRLPDGVPLHNGRGLHDASTAEHALALMLAAQRSLPRWVQQQLDGRWDPAFTRSLADSHILIVGYGSIGSAIERRLLPFEVRVTRVARRARPDDDVHGTDDLHRLLPDADVVVLVVPQTDTTRGLIGAAELALLRDDALVVNVGRGSALDTDALVAEAGRVRAALDVVEPEPLPAGHPLWRAPEVLLTPHVAGGSAAFRPRAHRFVSEQLRRWANGEPLANRIDLP